MKANHLITGLFLFALINTLILCTGCSNTDFGAGNEKVAGGSNDSSKQKTSDKIGNQDDGSDPALGQTATDTENDVSLDSDAGTLKDPKNDDLDIDETSRCVDKTLKTKVRLLTPLVANGVPGNSISYEISIVDCHGRSQSINAQEIQFDIDVEVDESVANTYTATAGSEVISGTLSVLDGSDLFGNTGEGYFHHKADQTFESTKKMAVILKIDLQGQELYPNLDGDESRPFSVKTYLKFGKATPVAQTILVAGLN